IPSVRNRAMIVSAANSSATIVNRTSSLLTAVQHDCPTLDPHWPEHAIHPPGIGREQVPYGLLRLRRDDVHRFTVAFERTAQDDRPLVDEAVHERGVVVPAVLLPHVADPVPAPAALAPQDVVLHYS